MDWPAVVAIYGAALSTLLLVLRIVELRAARADLRLTITTGIPVGGMEHRLGSKQIVEVTAASRGRAPISVSSLGPSLSDGRHIPVIDQLPNQGVSSLPAILATGQHATCWIDYQAF
jgi:hypothetical protein